MREELIIEKLSHLKRGNYGFMIINFVGVNSSRLPNPLLRPLRQHQNRIPEREAVGAEAQEERGPQRGDAGQDGE